MHLAAEREAIVKFGRKLITSNLTTGSGGNLSVFNRDQGLVAIKPSGIEYFDLEPADVVVMTLDGEVVEGRLKPSSEVNFHLGLMRGRADVNAVVHTHSVYATTIACLNWELPAVHYLVGFSGNKVPLAPYATFGTQALADNILGAIGDYRACLLANHGLVTVGNNLATAFAAAEEIELVARLYYQSRCIGDPVILSDAEMARVCEKFKTYGQKK
jgi:L-fuculose-phosphate aldolase